MILSALVVGCGGGATNPVVTGGTSGGSPTFIFGGGTAGPPPPSVTGVSPNSGPGSGGTTITITGSNFDPQATVLIGGIAPTSTQVVSGTQITATTPPHAAGQAEVQVINPDQQRGVMLNAFTFTQVPPPSIVAVAPNSGPSSGGTLITINGADFQQGAVVLVGGALATGVTFFGPTQLQAITPGGGGSADVTVRNPDGQLATLQAAFNYSLGPAPTITNLSPIQGPSTGGTIVTITGTDFVAGAAVLFGGVASSNVTVVNATTIRATTPMHAPGLVDIVVRNPDNQTATFLRGFSFNPGPVVTAASPSSGPTAGGTSVTIDGTNFSSGATVTFGTIAAASTTFVSSTQIVAVTASGGMGTVNITVRNPDGQTGSLVGGFNFLAGPAPTITAALSPGSGPAAGGTTVTITGTGFQTGASVLIGGNSATNVTVVSATQITAVTPAGAAGSADVQVTNPDSQVAILPNGFTYVPPPSVTGVAPNSGTSSGGTSISISGNNFLPGATVQVGGVSATNVTFSSPTALLALTPAHGAGVVDVRVTNPDGQTGTLTSGFTYVAIPTIASINPVTGPPAGGTVVVINGGNFVTGATVQFGGVAATAVTVTSATRIQCTTPAGTAGSIVDVTVRNPNNQSATLSAAFTYGAAPAPTVTAPLSPASGPITGGTVVTITGTNFQSGATVTFGATAAGSVTVVSSTQIRAVTAPASAGLVNVTLTNPDTQSVTVFNGYTYVGPPTVTGANPNSGPAAGGTTVVISGTNFQNGATVLFGSAVSSSVIFNGATQLTVVAPANSSGTVSITVRNPDNQFGSLASAYTYVANPAPTVTAVTPNIGPSSGLDTSGNPFVVTVTGTNFMAGAVVLFGGSAGVVTGITSTQIGVQIPAHPAGTVSIVVRNPDGQSATLPNSFTYDLPPSISAVSPNSGPTAGGTAVSITGANFLAGVIVLFGTTPATGVTLISPTQIQATSPAGTAGTVSVTVINPDLQSAVLPNAFSYTVTLPPPTMTTVSPSTGPTTGGTAVVITGTNFQSGATVTFGGTSGTVNNVTSTQIAAVTPPHSAGATNVQVRNPDGQTVTLTNGFTFTIVSLPGAVRPPLPALPQSTVDTTMPNTTGYTVVTVANTGNPDTNGANLQAAINNASCNPNGTIIQLIAGATYQRAGNFNLPAKNCAAGKWIMIRTDTPDANLPAPGTRMTAASSNLLPIIRIISANIPGIRVAPSAMQYRIIGILMNTPATGSFFSSEPHIAIGDGGATLQTTQAQQPNNIIIDRSVMRGSDALSHEIVGGVEFHCRNCALVDSYVDQVHRVGFESQAIRGWNGTGPVLVHNNFLSAAGMCVLIGGANPSIPNALLSDITFTRNHCFKPYSWKVGDPTYAGTRWLVKNHLELKHGVRVLIEGNVFENVWQDAQAGAAILFNTANSRSTPWAQVADVTFRYNKVIRSEGGPVEIGAWSGAFQSLMTQRVHIHDNLFDQQGGRSTRYFLVVGGRLNQPSQMDAIILEHNTVISSLAGANVSAPLAFGIDVPTGFTPLSPGGIAIHDNIFGTSQYANSPKGVSENCRVNGVPLGAFGCYTTDSWHKNLVYHTTPVSTWCRNSSDFSPWANNKAGCVNLMSDVQFVDLVGGDFRLATSSAGKNAATDGRDVGANIPLVNSKTAGVQ
jgi:hypothetical protein